MVTDPTPAFARQLDVQDDLAAFRAAFVSEEPDLIYLGWDMPARFHKK